jgi:hypothetical protein
MNDVVSVLLVNLLFVRVVVFMGVCRPWITVCADFGYSPVQFYSWR